MNHPEWEKENSLTSPVDRIRENKWLPEQGKALLTVEETKEAMNVLNNTAFVEKFPRVDRTYADPAIQLQHIGLISFTPAKGASPNENGVYGFAKLRGNYPTEIEASQRAEFLIREIDSYHQIYHTYVGRPFPITFNSDYSAEVDEIDIRKQTTETISENIKKQKKEDKQTIKEIKEREELLKADVAKDEEDPYDVYITLKVKKAQLSWTYLEHQKKLAEVKEIVLKTRKQLEEMDEKHPEFSATYLQKYMDARKEAGIKDENAKDNFIQYLVEDVDLGF